MDITLEKIDLIRERTGVSYREAKCALEQAQGNVIEALIFFEDQKKDWKQDLHTWKEEFSVKGTEVADKVKEVLRKGNISKITIKQGGKKVVEIPIVLGALGGILLPELAVLGVLGALFKQYTIELEGEGPIDAAQENEPTTTQSDPSGH